MEIASGIAYTPCSYSLAMTIHLVFQRTLLNGIMISGICDRMFFLLRIFSASKGLRTNSRPLFFRENHLNPAKELTSPIFRKYPTLPFLLLVRSEVKWLFVKTLTQDSDR